MKLHFFFMWTKVFVRLTQLKLPQISQTYLKIFVCIVTVPWKLWDIVIHYHIISLFFFLNFFKGHFDKILTILVIWDFGNFGYNVGNTIKSKLPYGFVEKVNIEQVFFCLALFSHIVRYTSLGKIIKNTSKLFFNLF